VEKKKRVVAFEQKMNVFERGSNTSGKTSKFEGRMKGNCGVLKQNETAGEFSGGKIRTSTGWRKDKWLLGQEEK